MSSYAEDQGAHAPETPFGAPRAVAGRLSRLGAGPMPAWVRYPAFGLLILFLASVDWNKAAYILHRQPFAIDYLPLWTAGRMALTHPGHLYDFQAITNAQRWAIGALHRERPWIYPPSALVIFSPLSLAPFWISTAVWIVGTIAAQLTGALKFISRDRILAVALLVALPASSLTVVAAQTTFLTAAAVAIAVMSLERRPIVAGILLGAAAAMKPSAMVALPLALIAARAYRPMMVAAVTGAALTLATAAWLGPGVWLNWLEALPRFERVVLYDPAFLPSLITPTSAGVTHHLGPDQLLAVRAVFVAAGAAVVWQTWRHRTDPAFRVIALMAAGLFASPYAMRYDAALFAIPAVALICRATSWRGVLVAAAAFGLLSFSIQPYAGPYAITAFVALTSAMAFFSHERARARLALASANAGPLWDPIAANAEGDRAAA
ncbi:MAG TPA: glycosyltransferase 87 family protein [Caulobacteraceae bacterium]